MSSAGNVVPADETAAAAREAVERLTAHGLRLATAESTVGGLIGHTLTDVPGSSRVFPGGITAYANPPKQALLGVAASVLEERGSVSPETALAMAQGASAAFGSDLALAETGIASALPPERASPERPPGLYFIALVARDYAHVVRRVFPGGREETKQRAAAAALGLVLAYLDELDASGGAEE